MSGDWINNIYESIVSFIPVGQRPLVALLFFTIIIVIYAVFVYFFYRFLAKKNLIHLNLSKFNTSDHPGASKIWNIFLYILEYIIILPILTFVWFTVLSVFILVLARGVDVSIILILSAALIASVRITAYITEDLSKDLAKMIPFTLLGLSIIDPDFFKVSLFVERLEQIPLLIQHIWIYLVFIVIIEFVMRMGSLIRSFFKSQEEAEVMKE